MRSSTYILIRVFLAIPTLFILLSTVFVVMRIIPGDPLAGLAGIHLKPEELAAIRHEWGLDQPMHIQFLAYLNNIIHLDLGRSYVSKVNVLWEIQQALPATVELTIGSIMVGTFLGILLGAGSVIKKGTVVEYSISSFTVWVYSMPSFWFSMLIQLFFGVYLGILPISGRLDIQVHVTRITGLNVLDSLLGLNFRGFTSSVSHLVLPTMAFAISILPIIIMISKSSMSDALSEQYIVTAKAKGLSESEIMFKHVLRNALLPIVTTTGMCLMDMLGGTVIIETVFSWPGLGSLLWRAAGSRDFALLQGIVVIYALIVVTMSTVMDVIYSIVDPRVKLMREV